MKNMTYRTLAIAALACLVSFGAGCSHPQQQQAPLSTGAGMVLGQDQFLTAVANLPMGQRVAYVQANGASVQAMDQAGRAKLGSLLPTN